jgi:hypothetical protein
MHPPHNEEFTIPDEMVACNRHAIVRGRRGSKWARYLCAEVFVAQKQNHASNTRDDD